MDVDVWPVQLPLMPRKYLATTFHIQGVSEVRIPVQIPLGPRRRFRPQPIHTSRAAIIMFENFASLIVTILAVIVTVILNSPLLLLFSERGSHFVI